MAIDFAVEQGSYLVGAAAALESATGRIGYIGANASALIEPFRAGFEQGALAADPDVEIVVDLVAPTLDSVGYVSPEIARREATAMYEQGVDVIFVPAGGSGIGVTDAATVLEHRNPAAVGHRCRQRSVLRHLRCPTRPSAHLDVQGIRRRHPRGGRRV